jgi:hypothetical protein
MNPKFLLLAGFAVLVSQSNAQQQFNEFSDWSNYFFLVYPIKNMNNGNITEIKMIHQSFKKSGKPKKNPGISWKKFDEKGRVIDMSYNNKKDELQKGITMAYDQNGRKSEIQLFRKNRLRTKTSFSYSDIGKYSEVLVTNRNGNIAWKSTWSYNTDGCETESNLYKKGGKLRNQWKYEYYDKCKLSKSTLYNGKGKIKNSWTYDCKQEGEKLEKRKNETQVCHWEQSSVDYIIKVTQTFNEKGKVIKYTNKFTTKDTLPVEHCKYDAKNRLVTKSTYNKNWDLETSHSRYKKNGKQLWEVTCEYLNDSLIISETTSHKGKIDGRTEYLYNNENMIMQKKVYRNNGNPRFTINMEYTSRK